MGVGVPEVNVQQLSDGSVRLQYEAENALPPPLDSETLATFYTVNGDIVLSPGPDGVGVAAQIGGDYPSLEIYQDSESGGTQQIYIDPADSGSKWGQWATYRSITSSVITLRPHSVSMLCRPWRSGK